METANSKLFYKQKRLKPEQLLSILDDYVNVCRKENIPVSKATFVDWSKKNIGRNRIEVIQRRFSSGQGKYDGWGNILKERYGIDNHQEWELDEILELYYKAWLNLKKENPDVRDLKVGDIAKLGLPNTTVQKFFNRKTWGIPNESGYTGHYKAVYLMFEKYGIKEVEKIPTMVVDAKYVGEELSKFKIDVKKFGLEKGPVNEQGVVALFMKIHQLIGFPELRYVTEDFPDCEAICNIGNGRNRYVNIEFKFQTFKQSIDIEKWKIAKMNYLICWEDNNNSLRKRLNAIGVSILSLRNILEKDEVIKKINAHFSN